MNTDDSQILAVLNAIARDNRASQRDLSKATGLNLAKVNFLLRRLKEKGQVKLRNVSNNPNKLRYLYILTPHGAMEKSRLTVRFAARIWREYSAAMERIQTSLARLLEAGPRRVLLLGATEVTEMIIEASCKLNNLTLVGILDPERAGETNNGIPIVETVREIAYDLAIPCNDSGFKLGKNPEEAEIPTDKLWLI
jgi:EPS-associated MarR family transcriptional regulator